MKKLAFVILALSMLNCDNLISFIIEDKGLIHKTWYVHPDSSLNTVQAALDSCGDGDSVLVAAGTYRENLVWPYATGICLVSESGADGTAIDGGKQGPVILIGNPIGSPMEVLIDGFTIQNGYWADGSGICCTNHGIKLTLIHNTVTGNWGDSTFYNSSAINAFQGHDVTMIENEVVNNDGFAVITSGSLTLRGNRIRGNLGGVSCSGDTAVITDNIISDNVYGHYEGPAWACGGITCVECTHAVIMNNVITGNRNEWYDFPGGGLFLVRCGWPTEPALVQNNTIDTNFADQGGGIFIASSRANLNFNAIAANQGVHGGAGLFIEDSDVKICGCIFLDNTGLSPAQGGDAIRVRDRYGGRVAVTYSDFQGNANYGIFDDSSSAPVDARLNWWGDPSGPAGAGPGTGDSVSAGVLFDPWLTEPWPGTGSRRLSAIRPER